MQTLAGRSVTGLSQTRTAERRTHKLLSCAGTSLLLLFYSGHRDRHARAASALAHTTLADSRRTGRRPLHRKLPWSIHRSMVRHTQSPEQHSLRCRNLRSRMCRDALGKIRYSLHCNLLYRSGIGSRALGRKRDRWHHHPGFARTSPRPAKYRVEPGSYFLSCPGSTLCAARRANIFSADRWRTGC